MHASLAATLSAMAETVHQRHAQRYATSKRHLMPAGKHGITGNLLRIARTRRIECFTQH